ncbi:tetratricopeptide repeat protein [Planctobacterium marinum]|uniref:tetratricopeptide repeat protein n=1 Tax=Planctobacterium marinum TaxID=1631968 RepID=UPI001E4AFAB7|nr:tetratricopeptide repeat protein [Planctobacterium marinum]MCC2606985.1 tetratricopeptide repeat protein [Planctobacterium marinum]
MYRRPASLISVTPVKAFGLALLLTVFATQTEARQYKSKLFNNSDHNLGAAESQALSSLEARLATATDPWEIAVNGQHLARQYAQNGQFEKAAQAYQKALSTNVLAEPVARVMTKELAYVLLQLKRFAQVGPLFSHSSMDNEERLLVARAALGLQRFHEVVAILTQITENSAALPDEQLQQVAELAYQASAFAMAIDAIKALLLRHPEDMTLIRQLTGLYIKTQKFNAALDLWSLASNQSRFVDEQDWLLLVELYQRQTMPDKAARILDNALQSSTVNATVRHWYRLFELWYQARETDAAMTSLNNSLRLSSDIQQGLLLADLQHKAEQWQNLLDTLTFTCQQVLPDRFTGKANLLLGIAYHKLGQADEARRAFINASLVSGEKAKAREWLAFIEASPANEAEMSELKGLCLPEETRIKLPESSRTDKPRASAETDKTKPTSKNDAPPLEIKTLPATRFYGTRVTTTPQELPQTIKRRTFALIKSLMKSGGGIAGNMHLLLDDIPTESSLTLTIAFPFSGAPANRGVNRIVPEPEHQALSWKYNGPAVDINQQWAQFIQQAIAEQHQLNGRARMVFLSDTSGTDLLDVELQLLLHFP